MGLKVVSQSGGFRGSCEGGSGDIKKVIEATQEALGVH